MRIKTDRGMPGPNSSEVVVPIPTVEGEEQIVVHRRDRSRPPGST